MISTPFWTGTGFMKWVLMTREEALRSVGSEVVEAAMRVIEIEDVFVARTAWDGQILASWEKIWVLRSGISWACQLCILKKKRGRTTTTYGDGLDDKVNIGKVLQLGA